MELKTLHTNDNDIFVGFAESRIGGRAENQDSYGFKETKLGFLLTVCDGMGGGPGGKTASTIAVTEIIAGVEESNEDEEVANILIKAVRRANMAILEAGNQTPSLQGMGSTATVLLLSEKSAFIAYVGDSRVYQGFPYLRSLYGVRIGEAKGDYRRAGSPVCTVKCHYPSIGHETRFGSGCFGTLLR